MSYNNNNCGLFGNDWIWIIIAVIVIVCLCNDNGGLLGNDCCNDRCDCC
ncbi:MAG: hypothetical protein IJA19_00920 [Clostridia bacterium]|nr:hypothetical protein [Clostridia bacterium]MBQ4542708.1 hypothetical protein [Clostridia bacterium]